MALALNSLLLIATRAYGSHYVVDGIAGIAIAAACWIAVARIIDAASRPQPEQISTIYDPPYTGSVASASYGGSLAGI